MHLIQINCINAQKLIQMQKLAEQLIVEKRDSISIVENEAKTEAH